MRKMIASFYGLLLMGDRSRKPASARLLPMIKAAKHYHHYCRPAFALAGRASHQRLIASDDAFYIRLMLRHTTLHRAL